MAHIVECIERRAKMLGLLFWCLDLFTGQHHAKMCLRVYADREGPDQVLHCPLTESLDTTEYECRAKAQHHPGVQLILAYSWARPAILVAGKGRGGNVFISSVSSLSFLVLFLPCPPLSSPLLSLLFPISLFLGDDTKWSTRVDLSLNSQHNQSESKSSDDTLCMCSMIRICTFYVCL